MLLDRINPTFLQGVARKVHHYNFQLFTLCEWIAKGGLEELSNRKYRDKPEFTESELQAVDNLQGGIDYVYDGERWNFTDTVRVFPSGVTQFQFKKTSFLGRYEWFSPREIASMKTSYDLELEKLGVT